MISFYPVRTLPRKKGPNREESGQQPSALTILHDPPRNGDLSSDPWQKIRKTAANSYNRRVFKAFEFCIPKRSKGSDRLRLAPEVK
jgi:hypothetical protein